MIIELLPLHPEGEDVEELMLVRYGAEENKGPFRAPEDPPRRGTDVIVRSGRGVEWGTVVCRIPEECDELREKKPEGDILRSCTEKDYEKREDIKELEQEEYQYCREAIERHDLPMQLIRVEHLFGGNKIIFFFKAERRVDFRKLVRDLAKKYKTRIEMRQVGVRDEARLLGMYGCCGRELCCRAFMNELKPVPMKMAKSQKSTLDPAKISGRCGRLKCCLRFENDQYRKLKKKLPRRGATVQTENGSGVVVGYHILKQSVDVKLEDETEETFAASEVEVVEN